MGTILGLEYSSVRRNEYDEREYFIDDWDGWYTRDDIKEELREINYFNNKFPNDCDRGHDGCNWSDD